MTTQDCLAEGSNRNGRVLRFFIERYFEVCGAITPLFVSTILADKDDYQLGLGAIACCGLTEVGPHGEPSHMQEYKYTVEDLAAAAGEFRRNFVVAKPDASADATVADENSYTVVGNHIVYGWQFCDIEDN